MNILVTNYIAKSFYIPFFPKARKRADLRSSWNARARAILESKNT